MTKWNPNQEAIFEAVANTEHNLVVQARAGTGKTTTLVEALTWRPAGLSTVAIAFNKAMQVELAGRVPPGVDTKTLHSVGFAACKNARPAIQVDNDKIYKIIKRLYPKAFNQLGKIKRLVGLGKNTLETTHEGLWTLAERHNLDDDEEHPIELLVEQAQKVLVESDNDLTVMDFDDMIYLPASRGWSPRTADFVMVDEAQDLNVPQLILVDGMLRNGGRLLAVGDDRQAIYGWRGAGDGVLMTLVREFNAKLLPMPITYRCPKKVVAIAKTVVEDFTAPPDAIEGEVAHKTIEQLLEEAAPGDFVLSRTNAPLMKLAIELLKLDRPATIAGKDIGKSLGQLITKSKTSSVAELSAWLENYLRAELIRLSERETELEESVDRIEAVRALCEGLSKTSDVQDRITRIFSDSDAANRIVCSTVHRAKGLERDRVWLLEETFASGYKSRYTDNLYYVAVTRARKSLFFAS